MEERVLIESLKGLEWSERAARVGVRAGFRCEYCDRDLLASVDNYKAWEEDHIVPVSCGGDKEMLSNLALACRTCNVRLKLAWDPRPHAKPNASREDLIAAVRCYIAAKRIEVLAEVLEVARLVRVGDC